MVYFFFQMFAKDKLVIGSSSKYKESDKGFIIIGKYINLDIDVKIQHTTADLNTSSGVKTIF